MEPVIVHVVIPPQFRQLICTFRSINDHEHRCLSDPNLDVDESPDSPSEGEDEEDYPELEQDDDGDDDDDDDDEDDEEVRNDRRCSCEVVSLETCYPVWPPQWGTAD